MLKAHVIELAKNSHTSALSQRRLDFSSKLQTIITELASKGIVGGPTVSRISEAAISEIAERKRLACEALRRALESAGVRYYANLPSDLNDDSGR